MPRLSAFIITRNEARDLPVCLESLRALADEIVVVDDHSQDATLEIARRYGARTLTRALKGFADQKQFALEQTTGEWVLSIDADERVTPELAKEILQIVIPGGRRPGIHQSGTTGLDSPPVAAGKDDNIAGYEIRRRFYFLGHLLQHGGLGRDWVLRLFRRTSGRFSDARVHEHIDVNGPVGRLVSPMEHFSYATLAEYVEKSNQYTSLAAQDLRQRGRHFTGIDCLRPVWELLSRVVFKGAWLDGRPGLLYASLSAHTAWLRSLKLWELK
ncbi:MAG: glycosyltransferase family 2 protein [Elusimicrobiota bacterium]|jgi:glycosyltransferase involved in cell wall biosynthesis